MSEEQDLLEFECLECQASFSVPDAPTARAPRIEKCPYCGSTETVEFEL